MSVRTSEIVMCWLTGGRGVWRLLVCRFVSCLSTTVYTCSKAKQLRFLDSETRHNTKTPTTTPTPPPIPHELELGACVQQGETAATPGFRSTPHHTNTTTTNTT
ncbi:hypothetical protein BJ878DRAFT_86143 [Calycina marina]|uniref:Uncharacterized protein n=1 Tax=Calycina marina TaxID=1763456 RepID=A0A9P8CG51_9HELO|nr:hypothetical protein BJ878DRAFT_86143 [Calycina marina]